MSLRPAVSLADVFRAIHDLDADSSTRQAIMRLLGFEASISAEPARLAGVFAHSASPEVRPNIPRRPSGPIPVSVPSAPVAPAGPDVDPHTVGTNAWIVHEATRATPPPAWFDAVEAIAFGAAPDSRSDAAPRPVEALFPDNQARALITAALATRAFDGTVDVQRVIEALTLGRPLGRLPRVAMPTLRRGVQVIVDQSPAMDPYSADQDDLLWRIVRVVGEPRVSVVWSDGPPVIAVGSAASDDPSSWGPPAQGTPIVVLSDLGIGGPPVRASRSSRGTWRELARRARTARCPVLALVPFPPARWPVALTRVITLVHWDRGTTVGTVRRAVGPGHRSA